MVANLTSSSRGLLIINTCILRSPQDILSKILNEEANNLETKAAEAFLKLVPDAADLLGKGGVQSSTATTVKRQRSDSHSAWKYDTTHFKHKESQVGPNYQVDILPTAGSYVDDNTTGEDAYDGGPL